MNLNVESLQLLSMTKVKSSKYAWSSDLFRVINGFSLHSMIIIAPHSTRAACHTVLLTSNTKRRAFFLVRGHSETHLLESSVILLTSYSSITIRVSTCTFPKFRHWKKDFTAIKFSRECRKFFINHINCKNSKIKSKSNIHFICTLSILIKGSIEPTHGSVGSGVKKLQSMNVLKWLSTEAEWEIRCPFQVLAYV